MSGPSNAAHPIEPNFKRTSKLSVIEGAKGKDVLQRKEFGKTIHQHVYEFAVIVAAVSLIVANFKLWKGAGLFEGPLYWIGAAALIMAAYNLFPRLLIPVWRGWIKFGGLLEIVMSNLILGTMWVCLFIPIAFFLKVSGKGPIALHFKSNRDSYWEDRSTERDDMKLLERQF